MRMGLLGEELSKGNNDITWFSSSFDHFKKIQYCDEDKLIDIQDNYHLQLIYSKGYKKNISVARIINHKKIAIKLRKIMRRLDKPDIIFASYPTIEFALEAVKYGKKNNVPVVIDIRDLWPDTFNHNLHGIVRFMSKPFIYLLNRQAKYILSNCYKITAVSDLVLDWGLKKGNKIKSILDKSFYIGYNNKGNRLSNVDTSIIDNNGFNICFFATINSQFNYEAIKLIAKSVENDNVTIIVCGDGPMINILKDKCKNTSNVKILGWQNGDVLESIIRKCKLSLAPYNDTFDFQMGISNKFCEYLSYGLPIILTSSGFMKQIIEKNQVGFASDDPQKIRDFIIKIKENKKMYDKYSGNARKLFLKKFDANIIYPDMVKYLEEVKEDYCK